VDNPNASDVPPVWSRPTKLVDTIAGHLEKADPCGGSAPRREAAAQAGFSQAFLRFAAQSAGGLNAAMGVRAAPNKYTTRASYKADFLGKTVMENLLSDIRDCPETA